LSDGLRVLLISGSTRNGSANTAALATAAELAPAGVTPVAYGGLAGLPAFNPDDDAGRLPQLAPGFDIVGEARRFGGERLAAQLSPEAIRKTAADELAALVPLLRRLPRRIDRIGGALEDGRLTLGVRLLADPADRRYLTGLVHQVLLAFLAAASGIMAVLMIGLHGGPGLTSSVSLYSFLGYCLLVTAAILAVRVLVQVFRPDVD
jgi:ubiquinone biosynthesis protein